MSMHHLNFRSVYMDWISDGHYENPVFVTLATNCENSNVEWSSQYEKQKYFQNKINSWDAAMCRHFIGKHYTDFPSKRQSGIMWTEHASTNIHYHGHVDIRSWSIKDYTAVSDTKWRNLVPSGTVDIQPVTDPKRLIGYMMKKQNEWSLKNNFDQMIFLPHPNKSRNFRLS